MDAYMEYTLVVIIQIQGYVPVQEQLVCMMNIIFKGKVSWWFYVIIGVVVLLIPIIIVSVFVDMNIIV